MTDWLSGPKIAISSFRSPDLAAVSRAAPASSGVPNVFCEAVLAFFGDFAQEIVAEGNTSARRTMTTPPSRTRISLSETIRDICFLPNSACPRSATESAVETTAAEAASTEAAAGEAAAAHAPPTPQTVRPGLPAAAEAMAEIAERVGA